LLICANTSLRCPIHATDAGHGTRSRCDLHRAPREATLRRVLERVDGDALDGAIGAWLASQEDGVPSIAVDGKPL
jgi:hypothetical protein